MVRPRGRALSVFLPHRGAGIAVFIRDWDGSGIEDSLDYGFGHQLGQNQRSQHISTSDLHSFSLRIFLDGSQNPIYPPGLACR